MGLLLVILSFIFMKGNSVRDSEFSPKPPYPTLPGTLLTDTPFSRRFVGVPPSAPCVPRVGYGGTQRGFGGMGLGRATPH